MLAILITTVLMSLYVWWLRGFISQVRTTSWNYYGLGSIRLFLVTFSVVVLVYITWDLLYFQGAQGKVIQKITVKEQKLDQNDPFEQVNASSPEENKLDVVIIKPNEMKTTFKNVAGQEEAKAEVMEVVDFLKHPAKYTALGAELPKGVLMYGPPGTGKTLMARAVAGESGVTFIAVDGSAFDEMWVGVGAARVRELFNLARKHQPCVVFIDEIDSLAPSRSAPGSNLSGKVQTVNQLLAEMDNVIDNKNENIIIMGATNQLDNLDEALLRPGRFDRKVYVRLPNRSERKSILELYLKRIPYTEDVSLESLAGTTFGFSGADIKNLVNEAALHAARKDKNTVNARDFSEAIDKLKLGLEVKTAVVSEKEKRLTAYHEAGHTLVGVLSPHYNHKFNKVTIGVRDATLGVTHFEAMDDQTSQSKAFLEDYLAMLLAGHIAESLVLGEEQVTTGSSSDLSRAAQVAQSMVLDWGLSSLSQSTAFGALKNYPTDKVNAEIQSILDERYSHAKAMLIEHRAQLDALAKALLEKEILDHDEVMSILGVDSDSATSPVNAQASD